MTGKQRDSRMLCAFLIGRASNRQALVSPTRESRTRGTHSPSLRSAPCKSGTENARRPFRGPHAIGKRITALAVHIRAVNHARVSAYSSAFHERNPDGESLVGSTSSCTNKNAQQSRYRGTSWCLKFICKQLIRAWNAAIGRFSPLSCPRRCFSLHEL